MKITINKTTLAIIATATITLVFIFFLITNITKYQDKKKPGSVILLDPNTYTAVKMATTKFRNTGITTTNDLHIILDEYTLSLVKIPNSVKIYSYQEVSDDQLNKIKQGLSNTTGLIFSDSYAEGKSQSASINYRTKTISYTNGNITPTPFPSAFNDQLYLPKAKSLIQKTRIDLTGYEYTGHNYFRNSWYDLIPTKTYKNATSIKYTFTRKIDGYDVLSTKNNNPIKISIWLNTNGNLLKLEGIQFGKVVDTKSNVHTKNKKQIKDSVMNGDFTFIGGDIDIVGEKIKELKLTAPNIVYSIIGENLVPLLKLEGIAVTTDNESGQVTIVTALINNDKTNEINK